VVDQDQEAQFSDAFETGDMQRLHILWFERCERRALAIKREKKRQNRWTIYAAYGSILVAALTILTYLSKWLSSFFPKGLP
jgi:hypothetical protein